LALNQFVTSFSDKNALKDMLRNHIDKYHQYIDAVSDKGVQYGEVKDGKFIPRTSKSGDNELDFWMAAAHPEYRPLINEFVEMVSNANFGEKPRLRDKETPIGAMVAFANALADKQYLVGHRRLVDSLMPINCYAGRFAAKGADGGRHVPRLIKKWGYKVDDNEALDFLVAQLVAIDNKAQKEETEILLNEFGLADALKDKAFKKLVYKKLMNRADYIISRNDISSKAGGLYLFDALNALGIKCSKDDAYMCVYLMDDIGSYPSLEQLEKGNINEDDDFTPLDEKSYDDEDDDDDE
jgi:hypothetical protein